MVTGNHVVIYLFLPEPWMFYYEQNVLAWQSIYKMYTEVSVLRKCFIDKIVLLEVPAGKILSKTPMMA